MTARDPQFIGWQESGCTEFPPIALFNLWIDGTGWTTVVKETIEAHGCSVPSHPDFDTWKLRKAVDSHGLF